MEEVQALGHHQDRVIKRFWPKVQINADSGCWEWTGARDRKGYGLISIGSGPGYLNRAHRVSWMIAYGSLPRRWWVLHRCDNRRCIYPGHLFLGTCQMNHDDMRRKGRGATRDAIVAHRRKNNGSRNGQAVLDEYAVIQIAQMIKDGVIRRVIASKFGVGLACIGAIASGDTWSWLTGIGNQREAA